MGEPHAASHYPLWSTTPYRNATWVRTRPPAKRGARPLAFRPVEIAAALGITLVVDTTLWVRGGVNGGGYGLAILFAALPAGLFLASRAWRGSVRLATVAALLALVVTRCVFAPTDGTVLSGLALSFAFALTLRARRSFVPEVGRSALAAVAQIPSRIGAVARGVEKLLARTRLGTTSLLPIAIPAGLVAVFLGIFALANPLVARGLEAAWSVLTGIVELPSAVRVLFWTVTLVSTISLLRPAIRLPKGSEIARAEGDATEGALAITRNALVGLNVLFLAYNVLDVAYLWSGSPPPGMNTQQYAHAGAFWLTVALAMLTAVIGVMFRGALCHDERATSSRKLAFAWVAQGLVLGLGTYRRIAIHIVKSGLSDLRIVGILGTSLVVCGLILVALKLRNGKTFTWLVRRQLDAFAVTAVLYTVTPTHLISAEVNVARIGAGEYRPLLHAFRQAHRTESAAVFLPLLDHPDTRVRQGIAALLREERERLDTERKEQASLFQRDLATGRTLAKLDAAALRIDAALDGVAATDAKRVLLEVSHAANADRPLEELLSIPAASRY
ncbi:MAG TPA: DUF4153 domain-containing protein [Labilithrix sp.]|nr:DUF4153 domain-containing protein [Labilithrix sp.]